MFPSLALPVRASRRVSDGPLSSIGRASEIGLPRRVSRSRFPLRSPFGKAFRFPTPTGLARVNGNFVDQAVEVASLLEVALDLAADACGFDQRRAFAQRDTTGRVGAMQLAIEVEPLLVAVPTGYKVLPLASLDDFREAVPMLRHIEPVEGCPTAPY